MFKDKKNSFWVGTLIVNLGLAVSAIICSLVTIFMWWNIVWGNCQACSWGHDIERTLWLVEQREKTQ